MFLLISGLLGLISLLMASYGGHYLAAEVNDEVRQTFMTGVRYNQIYAIVLLIIGLLQPAQKGQLRKMLGISGWCFTIGTCFFITGVYGAGLGMLGNLFFLPPIGAVLLLAGWIFIAVSGILKLTNKGDQRSTNR